MFDKLLPAIESSLLSDDGNMPIVFEGLEHVFESKTTMKSASVHNTHELFYLRNGKVEFTIEGKKVVVERGNAIIIRPDVVHNARIVSAVADSLVLYFGFTKDRTNIKRSKTSLESFFNFADGQDETNSKIQPYIVISGSYKKSISNLMERIVEEKKDDNFSKELMMEILTVELMIVLSRALKKEWEANLQVKNGKARELVVLAKDYIDSNYESGITVANAASYVYLSQGYFTRAFRDEFGVSPMAYLMKKRIDKACELLENPEIKVSGIAIQAGFSSPQRFNVAFRKQMGQTPLEYRKQHIAGYEDTSK